MSAGGVEEWRKSVTASPAESEAEGEETAEDWRDTAATRVLSSSSKSRLACLRDFERIAGRADAADRRLLVKCLLSTIPRYVDTQSRRSALRIVRKVLEKAFDGSTTGAEAFPGLVKWLSTEALRAHDALAPAHRFNLLCWICEIFDVGAVYIQDFAATPFWSVLVSAWTTVIDTIDTLRPSMRHSAVVMARRMLRNTAAYLTALLETLLKGNLKDAVALGLVIDVAIRLKTQNGKTIVQNQKHKILEFYLEHCLGTRITPPKRCMDAFDDFIAYFLVSDDIDQYIIPRLEKLLIRQPESALFTATAFVDATVQPLDSLALHLRPQFATLARATSPATRASAVAFFSRLQTKVSKETAETVTAELLAPIRDGKTASAEHRAALFAMLAACSPHPKVAILALTSKESSSESSAALARHLSAALAAGEPIVDITRYRKGVLPAIGEALYAQNPADEAIAGFEDAIVPLLEAALKNASADPLESYVAIALGKRNVGQNIGKAFAKFAKSNPELQTLLSLTAKPTILLNERIYSKLSSSTEEQWFLRALSSTIEAEQEKIQADKHLWASAACPLIRLAAESLHHPIRRDALQCIADLTNRAPTFAFDLVLAGVRAHILRLESRRDKEEELEAAPKQRKRLQSILHALLTFSVDCPVSVKQNCVSRLVILAHHPVLASPQSSLWIDLIIKAGLRPRTLVDASLEPLLQSIDGESTEDSSRGFATASKRALTGLLIIAPDILLPQTVQRLVEELDTSALATLTEQDMAIWYGSDDQVVVDVLAMQKIRTHINAKDAAMLKWDAEQRQALAIKKKAVNGHLPALSKTDQALVDAQLLKERKVRAQVEGIFRKIRLGQSHLESVLEAVTVDFSGYAFPMVQSLLLLAQRLPPSVLAAQTFECILVRKLLVSFCRAVSEILQRLCTACLVPAKDLALPLTVATLRSTSCTILHDDLIIEPLSALVLRVLYRLRALAEADRVTPACYCCASPLISHVLDQGGLGLTTDEGDARQEQLQLAVDFIASQSHAAGDERMPRLQMIKNLLGALSAYPQLSKTAGGALAALGDAIEANATPLEINALLTGSLAEEAHIRLACLQALQPLDLTERENVIELWLLCHDDDERNRKLANQIWDENGLDISDAFMSSLRPLLSHPAASIRACTSRAIGEAAKVHHHQVALVVEVLIAEYVNKSQELLPEYDRFGMLVEASLNREDPWRSRVAVAQTLAEIAGLLHPEGVTSVLDLLIKQGALGDRNGDVRAKMLEAGIFVVDIHGKVQLQDLMTTLESSLSGAASPNSASDRVVEAVIVLFGRLARHLDASDSRIHTVTKRLLAALSTPSEDVQIAVSECLPPLVKAAGAGASDILDSLLHNTFHAKGYAERRGSAYGLAGAIKGRGISSLKEYDIIGRIRESIEDKKDSTARQGAVFAIETLSGTLGRIFEPYIIQVLPLLLQALGDPVVEVRNATQEAAKIIMSKISGHAVKLILPSLLAGLEDRQWRSKKGAIDLIGTMAYLAPRQLSLSLPTILPRLTEVLTDTHAQVRSAANASLKRFGDVITNPEIQTMQAVLLEALIDPTRKTLKALDTILATSFAHFLDTSSLALIVPVLERGIRDRSSELKRKAAQIVGTLANISEARDLAPYLPQLVPKVREVLVDPVPETRGTAAQALGGLVERLGEDAFPDLVVSLLDTLQSDTTGIDQQGAAQGLAEILAGLGTDRLDNLLPDILANTRSSRSYVREGFVSLLVFLPVTFGERFSPYLARIIEPVLAGLADESDYVRDASLKAGRMIVSSHSGKAIVLLLPELEKGLFDRNHRIRLSSMQLIGELLFKITGISGKAEMAEENEDDVQTAQVKVALIDVLGRDRRDRVLASIFIVRQDSSGPVRQLAANIWKALVSNTPRTVKEILAVLINIVVRLLAAENSEQRECAARALGDLCRKMGESVLTDLMPVLHRGASANERTRQGVQLALSEILAACSDTQIEIHERNIVESIRGALIDTSSSVRAAAAQAFDALQHSLGPRAIDMTVPALLDTLRHPGPSATAALAALREIMSVRADKIVPILIPTLIKVPITIFNARALASLVDVAGSALSRRLSTIIDALEQARLTQSDAEVLEEVQRALTTLLSSIKDDESLSLTQLHLLGLAKDSSAPSRAGACNMLAILSSHIDLDMSDYYVDWIRRLVTLFDDRDAAVVQAAWAAMNVFVNRIPKDDLENLAPALRRTIETTGTPGHPLPGFELGLKPVLPILLQGLLAGTADQREQSAYAMGDIVERTSLDALKPYVTQMAGPLIRIIAERFPAPVRAAILHSLTIIVGSVPTARPFYPQIQRTFSKSVGDPTSLAVRTRAAHGLGVLMAFQPRIDPLITELLNGAKTAESSEVRESYMDAIANSIRSGSKNMTATSQDAILELLTGAFDNAQNLKESTSATLARVFAAMLAGCPDLLRPFVDAELLGAGLKSQMASFCLRDAIELSPEVLYSLGDPIAVVQVVVKTAQIVDNPALARPARQARDLLRRTSPWSEDEEVQSRL